MVTNLILIGSGGCMRELVWQMQELNKTKSTWNILGYVDNIPQENRMTVAVGSQKINYLGDDDYLLNQRNHINAAICIASPSIRKKIALKLSLNPYIQFPNLILSRTRICEDSLIGKGCIFSQDVCISTNVTVGDFVFFNTGSMVCHDGIIGNYVTVAPDVKLAGAVKVGEKSELGMGAKVIQGVSIGENTVIGAGAVVVNDIKGNGTFVGVPAHPIYNTKY